MPEMLQAMFNDLGAQLIGMSGSAIFLGSWVLQAWESRRNGGPVVSERFFALRALACLLLTYEGMRSGSLALVVTMAGTFALMLYNIALIRRAKR